VTSPAWTDVAVCWVLGAAASGLCVLGWMMGLGALRMMVERLPGWQLSRCVTVSLVCLTAPGSCQRTATHLSSGCKQDSCPQASLGLRDKKDCASNRVFDDFSGHSD
jgi:hypothetical protein